MSKKNRKIFNINKHQIPYQVIADVLNRGGIVACASDLGCVILGRFDLVQIRERLKLWPGRGRNCRLFLCVGNYNEFTSICEGRVSAELSVFLRTLCLNWSIIFGVFRDDYAKKFAWSERKMGFLCTQEATIKTVLDAVSFPLLGTIIEGKGNEFVAGGSNEEILCSLANGADLFLVSENNWKSIKPLIIDFSSNDWRILQLGPYTYEELTSLSPKRLILSADRLQNVSYRHVLVASIWVYRGNKNKITSRFIYMFDNDPNFAKKCVFFLQSEEIYQCVKNYVQDEETIFKLFPAKDLQSEKLIEKFSEVRLREDIRTIIVELSSEEVDGLEKFIAYVDYLADQQVNLSSRYFGE